MISSPAAAAAAAAAATAVIKQTLRERARLKAYETWWNASKHFLHIHTHKESCQQQNVFSYQVSKDGKVTVATYSVYLKREGALSTDSLNYRHKTSFFMYILPVIAPPLV